MTVCTVTLNPSIDMNTECIHIAPQRKLRCSSPQFDPGGGGINVSAVLRELGDESTAVFPCGGSPGEILCRLMEEKGIPFRSVRITGKTRINLTATDSSGNSQYRFVMPGPYLNGQVAETCLQKLRDCEPAPEWIVLSGSFPPGVEPGFVKKASEYAEALDARLIIDTSGGALSEAVKAGVFLVKPNMRELRELFPDTELETEQQMQNVLGELVRSGGCQVAVLSLGAGGLLLASEDVSERMHAPAVPIRSRVGAGDSMVAGIIAGLSRGWGIRRSVQYGLAAGSAAVMTPGTQLCRKEDTENIFNSITGKEKP